MATPSDFAILAMLQSLLGGSAASEERFLLNELARRLILSGLAVSSGGVFSFTVPFLNVSALIGVSDATKFLNGAATPAFAQVKDSDLSTTNVTTNNVTTAKHGFAPILPNDATKFLDGTGAYTVPPGAATDANLTTTDITTNDVSTSKHGFTPKAPNSVTKFLRGDASWAQINNVATLTDGATPALDASLGTVFRLAAAGDRTIAVPSNAVTGMKIVIQHFASGGARTLALNTGAGGFRFGTDITALTQTASGKTDYIGAIYNGTDSKWDVVAYTRGF